MFYGEVANTHVAELKDISSREFLILAILAVLVLAVGVYPQSISEIAQTTSAGFLKHMATSKLIAVGI